MHTLFVSLFVCMLQVKKGTSILGQFAFFVIFLGYFGSLKLILKVMPRSWILGSKQICFGSEISEVKIGGRKKLAGRVGGSLLN